MYSRAMTRKGYMLKIINYSSGSLFWCKTMNIGMTAEQSLIKNHKNEDTERDNSTIIRIFAR